MNELMPGLVIKSMVLLTESYSRKLGKIYLKGIRNSQSIFYLSFFWGDNVQLNSLESFNFPNSVFLIRHNGDSKGERLSLFLLLTLSQSVPGRKVPASQGQVLSDFIGAIPTLFSVLVAMIKHPD